MATTKSFSLSAKQARHAGCVLALVLGCAVAHAADVYVSYAADGTPTFANHKNDASYVLLLKGPPVAAPRASATGRGQADLGKRRDALAPLIEQVAARYGLDPALVRAIAHVESSFNSRAVSPAGAAGVMQLMPATAQRYGTADRMDPAQNLDAGARYFRDLLTRYSGNLALALAAYNSGERNVERHSKNVPPFRETMLYVPEVLTRYESYRQVDRQAPQQ